MKKSESVAIYTLGALLILAGIYTFYSTSSTLFHLFSQTESPENYIPITQYASLICSFLYLISGILFFVRSKWNKWSTTLLFIATIIMFVGYIGMLFHINSNKPFELSIIPEMLIRTTATMLYAAAAWYFFTRMRLVYPEGHNAKTFKKLMKEYKVQKKDYSNPNYQ